MSDNVFQVAYSRVRGRFSDQEWFGLTPRQITEAIYDDMSVLDQERVGSRFPGQESQSAFAAE